MHEENSLPEAKAKDVLENSWGYWASLESNDSATLQTVMRDRTTLARIVSHYVQENTRKSEGTNRKAHARIYPIFITRNVLGA
jgi:hypothetical protein